MPEGFIPYLSITDYRVYTRPSLKDYTLTLKENGTARYTFGIFAGDGIEQLEGIWRPAEDLYGPDTYILELVPTGGSLHKDGIEMYHYSGVYRLTYSEKWRTLEVEWIDGDRLFHYYTEGEIALVGTYFE